MRVQNKKYGSIVYVSPVQLQNMGNFKEYLVKNSQEVIAYHFYNGYSNEKSYMEKYENGKEVLTKKFPAFKPKINIIRTILYRLYLEYILIRFAKSGSYVIVEKPFFLILSILLKRFKNLHYVFWIGDYYPDLKGFMKIYNLLADFYSKSLDIVWYVSPPLIKLYLKKSGLKNDKRRMLVSLGTKFKLKGSRRKINKKVKLGYLGMLKQQKGLDFVFSYLKKYNNATLDVIGEGYKLEYYKQLAKNLQIDDRVVFYGFVDEPQRIIKNWDIGVALYENTKLNNARYCEPTKIKNYLEYGLPVITTKATYFYKDIENKSAGIAINESLEQLNSAITKIRKNYSRYKKGAKEIVEKYEYNKYYSSLLTFMEK